jgi:hypothetical protein
MRLMNERPICNSEDGKCVLALLYKQIVHDIKPTRQSYGWIYRSGQEAARAENVHKTSSTCQHEMALVLRQYEQRRSSNTVVKQYHFQSSRRCA